MDTNTILSMLVEIPGANFQLHSEGYAEPGYGEPESGLIATGDWNPRSWNRPIPKQDQTMPRCAAILERLGVELEWEDEWATCEECEKLVRTQADSYDWTRSYWDSGGCGIYCQDCVLDDPEDYLDHLEGNTSTPNTLDLDLEALGYQKVEDEYENGLYGGQCDDPVIIGKSLTALDIKRFVFNIDSVGQFDLAFSVWIHKTEWSKLKDDITSRGADPAVAMRNALRDASKKISELRGDGIRVARCHQDGTATARLVSTQDFIDGKALD